MLILCINSGSSSVKYRLFDHLSKKTLCTGGAEKVGSPDSFITYTALDKEEVEYKVNCPEHKDALMHIIKMITDPQSGVIKSLDEVSAVGHRVLHGGTKIKKSVLIDDQIIKDFKSVIDLGPLHMPANIAGIEAAREVLPHIPHMAIIDTAWHQTMPDYTARYAVPEEWYTKYGIRKYGFHGSSHLYVSRRAAVLLGKKPSDCNVISLHIGNGASANAIRKGKSFDTSMGLTPLEGLVMGTRSGDLDPAVVLFMMEKENLSTEEMNTYLNKKSGLLALTKEFTDRRDVIAGADERKDPKCQLAINMETYRVKKYIGAYMAAMNGADAIVLTGGVGERSPRMRKDMLTGLECMGIKLDEEKNNQATTNLAEMEISTTDSPVKIFVIPTDEETVFIEDVVALLKGDYNDPEHYHYSFQDPEYINLQREEQLRLSGKDKIIGHLRAMPPKK